MAWIFDGDIHEFLGAETEEMSEDKIFDKYYRNRNSVLDDCMRSGCLSHWRESVMHNISRMLQNYINEVEFGDDAELLRALGEDEDFCDDDAYARDLSRRKGVVRRSRSGLSAAEVCEDSESAEEDEEEDDDEDEEDEEFGEGESSTLGSPGGKEVVSLSVAPSCPPAGGEAEETPVALSASGTQGVASCADGDDVAAEEGVQDTEKAVEGAEGEDDDDEEDEDSVRTSVLATAVEKMRSYMKTAWKWHCSMIEGGAYYSDVIEESNEIISAHFDSLASDMGQFVS
eukprot:650211-Rhodomonas_salina.1